MFVSIPFPPAAYQAEAGFTGLKTSSGHDARFSRVLLSPPASASGEIGGREKLQSVFRRKGEHSGDWHTRVSLILVYAGAERVDVAARWWGEPSSASRRSIVAPRLFPSVVVFEGHAAMVTPQLP